jgi:hypothetical protein
MTILHLAEQPPVHRLPTLSMVELEMKNLDDGGNGHVIFFLLRGDRLAACCGVVREMSPLVD